MNLKKAKFIRKMAAEVHRNLGDKAAPAGAYLQHTKRGYLVNHPASPRGISRRIKREVS